MRTPPDDLDPGTLTEALADGWGIAVDRIEYAPVGAGSHHWTVAAADDRRAFATVDHLGQKAWLGDDPDAAFAGLRAALDTAVALAGSGLGFVVAPLPSRAGESLRRIGELYALAVYPFVDGTAGRFDDLPNAVGVVDMLVAVHGATPAAPPDANVAGLSLPGGQHIEMALSDAGVWLGGPYSQPAQRAFDAHRDDVVELLGLARRLAAAVRARGRAGVVTHGEPHPANILTTAGGKVLVDWDTVALAPPERDLWMLAQTPDDDAAVAYAEATGRAADANALDFFRLTWDLKDLAEYLNVLRAPHVESEDTARELRGLEHCVSIRDDWAALLR
ncbi:MAG: phosphotransferase family protein [Gaiellales bacterium]